MRNSADPDQCEAEDQHGKAGREGKDDDISDDLQSKSDHHAFPFTHFLNNLREHRQKDNGGKEAHHVDHTVSSHIAEDIADIIDHDSICQVQRGIVDDEQQCHEDKVLILEQKLQCLHDRNVFLFLPLILAGCSFFCKEEGHQDERRSDDTENQGHSAETNLFNQSVCCVDDDQNRDPGTEEADGT